MSAFYLTLLGLILFGLVYAFVTLNLLALVVGVPLFVLTILLGARSFEREEER